MLEPYRVLDLTDERGLFCGQILADLGADVVAVEPPGGSSARWLGPFLDDRPDPEGSLWWWSYARNKRGITLDLQSETGRGRFRELVRAADFVIESLEPGELARRGL
ncbi:MAG: CoA transferase, partial [Dehalococcoidia bacterium]